MPRITIFLISTAILLGIIGFLGINLALGPQNPSQVLAARAPSETPIPPANSIETAWDNQINSPKRFKVLTKFNQEAVLDKETGLVWERSPGVSLVKWSEAIGNVNPIVGCYFLDIGGRRGWRLAKIEELSTLVDETQPSGLKLPTGHPFLNIQSGAYWTITSDADPNRARANAFVLNFTDANLHIMHKRNDSALRWCVRAPGGFDPDAGG